MILFKNNNNSDKYLNLNKHILQLMRNILFKQIVQKYWFGGVLKPISSS